MLKAFPNGLNTQLGNWFDEGINISNGQWQKVALARAFAKNSDIYFLDEPNAAMDVITENEVLRICKELLVDKMGVIITHKFNEIITTPQGPGWGPRTAAMSSATWPVGYSRRPPPAVCASRCRGRRWRRSG